MDESALESLPLIDHHCHEVVRAMCVDTGVSGDLLSPAELAGRADARAYEIVRLETVAEQVAAGRTTATGFAEACRNRLAGRARHAAGFKSIAAYRAGYRSPPQPDLPSWSFPPCALAFGWS